MSTTATKQEVKARPILFSAPMIRAILAGRKTQTRRVLQPQPLDVLTKDSSRAPEPTRIHGERKCWTALYGVGSGKMIYCRFGEAGTHLWVREAWGDVTRAFQSHDCEEPQVWAYRADEAVHNSNGFLEHMNDSGIVCRRWRPSIFMPRWMSRITLEITNVRVGRLQDIRTKDIEAEGVLPDERYLGTANRYRHAFETGWDKLNAKRSYSFASNPFVWVLSFKVL